MPSALMPTARAKKPTRFRTPIQSSAPERNARAVQFIHVMIKIDTPSASTTCSAAFAAFAQAPGYPAMNKEGHCVQHPAVAFGTQCSYGKMQPTRRANAAPIPMMPPDVARPDRSESSATSEGTGSCVATGTYEGRAVVGG